jgi:hypothetical protein
MSTVAVDAYLTAKFRNAMQSKSQNVGRSNQWESLAGASHCSPPLGLTFQGGHTHSKFDQV